MSLIVDGNNVMGRVAMTEQQLINQLGHLANQKRHRMVAFFDGQRPGSKLSLDYGRLLVRYSGPGFSADQRILDFLQQQKDLRSWQLVSDDAELRAKAGSLGVRSLAVKDLMARIGQHRAEEDLREQIEKPVYEPEKEDLLRSMLATKGED